MYIQLKWSIIPYIIMYLIAFMLIGLMDLTNATFDPWRLLEAAYWQEVLLLTTGNVLVLLSTSDLYLMKILGDLTENSDKNSEWHKLQHNINRGVDALKENFRLWLHKDNMRVKSNTYRLKINHKLARLTKFTTYRSRLIYDKLEKARLTGNPILPPTTYPHWRQVLWTIFLKPRPNFYYKRRKRLEALLDESYIQDRIEYINIRYDKINSSFIRIGYNGEFNSGERRVESKGTKFFKDHSPRIIFTTAIIAIFRAFLYDTQVLSVAVVFRVTFKVIVLLSNILAGKNYAPRYFKEKILKDENLRLAMITEYLADPEFNPEEDEAND